MSVLFNIDHSTGDLSQYTSTVTDSGDLSVTSGAALAGTNYGLSCLIDDTTAIFGRIHLAGAVTQTRLRFYFDPNSLTMANNNTFILAYFAQNGGSFLRTWYLDFRYLSATGYRLILRGLTDGGSVPVNDVCDISDAPHYIEIHSVRAATDVSADGTLQWWVDGVDQGTFTGIDNYNLFADYNGRFIVGATADLDTGTSGTFYLDEFKANDDGSVIGPVGAATTYTDTGSDVSTHQASGADPVIRVMAGTDTSTHQASATSALQHAETVTAQQTKQSSALDKLKSSETGAAQSSHQISGADVIRHIYADSASSVAPHVAGGVDAETHVTTGAAVATLAASGATVFIHAETGAVQQTKQSGAASGQVYTHTASVSAPHKASGVDIPWYDASSLTLTTGAISSGALEDTYSDNGVELVLTEVTGTPGFVYDFTFGEYDPVPNNVHTVLFKAWYQGNKAHNVKLQQWNYTTSGWTNVTGATQDFPDVASEQTYAFKIDASADYLSNGQIKLRLNHTSPGNPVHLMHIDQMYLTPIKVETASVESPRETSGIDRAIERETGQVQAPHVSIGADVIVTSDTGAVVTPHTASGADVYRHLYIDTGAAEQTKETSGLDAAVLPDTGAAQLTTQASGDDVARHLYIDTGAAQSTREAGGNDAVTLPETGVSQAALSASGLESVATTDTGASESPLAALGADYLTNVTSGAVETPHSASGDDVYTPLGTQTYTETGISGITAQASGADVYSKGYIEAGSAESPRETSGADVVINADSGAARSTAQASGADSIIASETGATVSTRAGSVADSFFHAVTYVETGAAQSPHGASGTDNYTKAGGGHGDVLPVNAYRGIGLEDEWLGRMNDDEEVLIAYAIL